MKLIKTEEAVGSVLCHDITQIIPGVVKDAVFRKGHVVTQEDIPVLLSVGKEHLYVWEKQEGMLHENEAAEVLRRVCQGRFLKASKPKEGKIELTAETDGLLKVDKEKLNAVNGLGQIVIASRHGNFPVKKGDKVAGMRVVPLVIEEEKMQKACEVAGKEPIFRILPYQKKKHPGRFRFNGILRGDGAIGDYSSSVSSISYQTNLFSKTVFCRLLFHEVAVVDVAC